MPYGPDVNFVAGHNLDIYKYYIDFVSKFEIKYIVINKVDKSTTDTYTPNPKFDVKELLRYVNPQNVDIKPSLTWLTFQKSILSI